MDKKLNRIIAMMLAAALVLSTSIFAFADTKEDASRRISANEVSLDYELAADKKDTEETTADKPEKAAGENSYDADIAAEITTKTDKTETASYAQTDHSPEPEIRKGLLRAAGVSVSLPSEKICSEEEKESLPAFQEDYMGKLAGSLFAMSENVKENADDSNCCGMTREDSAIFNDLTESGSCKIIYFNNDA